ncbi:hypothetical protein F4777DRAFT_456831 [Nemania sp. FL0916]|nr:hypothetical protein F4777DRAFT_456831 [Nemania sp. FL0916]
MERYQKTNIEPYSDLEVRYDKPGNPYHSAHQPESESSNHQTEPSSNQELALGADTQAKPEDTKSRFQFSISRWRLLCGIIVIVVVIVVASTLGAVLSRRKNHQASQPPSQPPSTLLHSNSSVSASSWIDPVTGFVHRAVYFQDSYNSIIARVWQSNTQNWDTLNFTSAIKDLPKDQLAAPGTPLASGSLSAKNVTKTGVWYLDIENRIEWLGLINQPGLKNPGSGYPSTGREVHPNSSLAAFPSLCDANCTEGWILAYQNTENQVQFKTASINDGFLTPNSDYSDPSGIASGSSMTLLPLGDYQLPSGMTLIAESLTSTEGGEMVSKTLNSSSEVANIFQDDGTLLKGLPAPSSRVQFTGTALNDWFNVVLALYPDGTINGVLVNQTQPVTTYDTFDFGDGPSANFSAVAMTLDRMLYGIYNDTVVEYDVFFFPDGTVHFNYTDVIFP